MTENKQTGSHHIIILAAITIVLIGAVGFMFWKNIVHKDDEAASGTKKQTASNTTTKKSAISGQPLQAIQTLADGTQYLTVKDWGVRFRIANASLKGSTIQTVRPKVASPEITAFATTRMINDKGCGASIGVELVKTPETVDTTMYSKLGIEVNRQSFYVSKKMDVSACSNQSVVSKDWSAIQAMLQNGVEAIDPQTSSPSVSTVGTSSGSSEPPASTATIESFHLTIKAPTDGTVLTWAKYKYSTDDNNIGFTSSKVGGPDCTAENGAIGVLTRSTKKIAANPTVGSTPTLLNKGNEIMGYYYAFVAPNGDSCNTGDQAAETAKLKNLLLTTFSDS